MAHKYVANDFLPTDQQGDLLNAIEESGARWVRITAYWNEIEQQPGWWSVVANGFDAAINAAAQRGLSIVVVVEGVPTWASADSSLQAAVRPDMLPAWQSFLRRLEATYGDRVRYWTILNEANCRDVNGSLSNFHGYSRSDTPEQRQAAYNTMLRSAAEVLPAGTIIAANPVLTGATQDEYTCIAASNWISSTLAVAGASIGPVAGNTYAGTAQEILERVDAILPSRQGHPFWLTEFGIPNTGAYTSDVALREEKQGYVTYGVLRGMLRRRGDGWAKAFAYKLWAPPDDDQFDSLVDAAQDIDGRYIRKDPWHLYRHVALNGEPDWRPITRWWRWGDNFYTTPSEGDQTANGYGWVHYNDWSVPWHGYRGWAPLFRCWYPDSGMNDAHMVTQYFGCNEPGQHPGYYQEAYGYMSPIPRPELDLVPLFRFRALSTHDYEVTTNSARAAQLRSPEYRAAGWEEMPQAGWVWPSEYRPQPLVPGSGPTF